MSLRLIFHPAAEGELDEAARYYGQIDPALESAFLNAIWVCAEGILTLPNAGSPLPGNFRRRLARRFPYAVIYTVGIAEI